LPAGINCVVGTTGLSNDVLEKLAATATAGACLFYAPNFTTGAVLMMQFARAAAPYFPEAEVIEFHHANKLDSPSGTAVRTAQIIAEARGGRVSGAPGKETE
ncbi:MAG: dihydrodipicolinate reductase C-terminal domain-containing protein, partial [Raoultibacter sp.]